MPGLVGPRAGQVKAGSPESLALRRKASWLARIAGLFALGLLVAVLDLVPLAGATLAGVVVAQVFVSMPFLVLTVEAAFRQHDARLDDAARTLGASPWYVMRRVTLPSVRPALVAGAVLAWARALGEFGATITFAGNLPGTTQTMPLATCLALETDPERALVLSLVLVTVSFVVLVALRDRWLSTTADEHVAGVGR